MSFRKETLAEGVELYCGDCFDVLPTLGHVDAVITDPPYGLHIKTRVSFQDRQEWDSYRVDIQPIIAAARYAVIWGGQYYAHDLPLHEGWATWVKRPLEGIEKKQTHATTEMAWSNFGKPRFYKHVWDGGMREGDPLNREFIHPSQKPVELMSWCIGDVPDKPKSILDPFMGSGTTGVAAVRRGLHFVGIEKDPKFFATAHRRIEDALSQPDMFKEPTTAKQTSMFNEETA